MVDSSQRLQTLEETRQYVAQTLSNLETLEADRFQLSQQVLSRAGKPCGMYFCLQGPRALRLTAIWETDGNTILFLRLLRPPDAAHAIDRIAHARSLNDR
jgi:hypothetical protein